jgi:hypothetical protein
MGGASAAFTLLFLPPTLSLVHPTLCNSASILVLLTPARNSARFLAPPRLPPPDGNNDADDQRSVNTATTVTTATTATTATMATTAKTAKTAMTAMTATTAMTAMTAMTAKTAKTAKTMKSIFR